MNLSDWSPADRAAAAEEGWDLFECDGSDNGPVQVQKFDMPEQGQGELSDDCVAWELIWTAAARGSALHQKALDVVRAENPDEYEAIRKWVTLVDDARGEL